MSFFGWWWRSVRARAARNEEITLTAKVFNNIAVGLAVSGSCPRKVFDTRPRFEAMLLSAILL
jgi:hypothetical protein